MATEDITVNPKKEEKQQVDQQPKTKLRSIMEAASALTRLGDEDSAASALPSPKREEETEETSETSETGTKAGKSTKRFIPEHKKPDAALTFPEKLMNLMKFADKYKNDNYCCSWLPDGKSFVVSNPDDFTRQILPKYFKATKFSSFTRKLYRWGFRQVNRGIGPDDPIIFGNEFFQRDDAELMAKMRSVTAASTRKIEHNTVHLLAQKRALDAMESEQNHKRVLLDQIMQQKAISFHNQSLYAPQHSALNLTSALRPGLGAGGYGMGGSGLKPFDMLGQSNPLMSSFPAMQGMQGNHHLGAFSNPNHNSQYPSAASTAEIVNAAINALRFAT
jgi:hypothetical protein